MSAGSFAISPNSTSKSFISRSMDLLSICEKIKTMPMGKSPGFDNVSNEHFKYASEKLYMFLYVFVVEQPTNPCFFYLKV